MRRRGSTCSAQQPQQRPHKQQQQQRQQNQRLIPGQRCSLLMLLIVGQAVYASTAGSELIANRSATTAESPIMLANFTAATPPAPRFSSPFREQDVAEGEEEEEEEAAGGGQANWLEEQHPLTISRPPRAGRSERQAEEDQVDRCRLFVEGDPTKNELYSPEYPNLYPKNINCTRVITAPKGQIIRLDFRNSFNIEAKEGCKFDFLEIRDGQYGFSSLIGKFCGTDFPPEITSKERYLWLHFHSDETIEYTGFSAVYEYLDRSRDAPSTDLNCTIDKGGFEGFINSTDVPAEIWEQVNHNKIALDCIWRIQVKENWKIFLKFLDFKLSKPNDCQTNFLDIFPEQTVMPLRVKNFCGSAGESITAESNILHLRFYADQTAINSTFGILFTAFRERGAACTEDEYDCEDATCISKDLKCNNLDNCKFRWDEEGCTSEAAGQSEHVVIIVIVFGLILGGMVITFIVNCIRKIIRDQKIIRDVPALSDGIYHIDSFILEAPKSAIFVGLQNDFMCDFSYSSDGQMAPNVGHETRDEQAAIGGDSDFDSQMDSPKQTCDCDFDLDVDVDEGEHLEEDDVEEELEEVVEVVEEEEEQDQEQEHQVDQDQEYDDGIGFSCDSDSGLTLPEDDDEFVLVTGQCLPSNSSHSCSSSMQCSSGSSGGTVATSSSASMELDMVLTPPPPPTLAKPKSGVHPLKFLHKII
ncbi:uncharacterized protein Dyak_GE17077, isoform F [Drosophila yakuba]|uniref:Uncharacterized protein, isoform A n=1 Tax=Drosophila yakuba TaxID=7245 RepID=B4Q2C0_DROYA|nr:uncharacterized protein Dyak_GE17077, isoform A [Drosophila yakuba]KRK06213.1 uncharacterized protein Dyak_GE17077, isoform B [Drosophila yakuba]KRK06217.1 uncharacterized protein Dyak_GE17077, isoform F [Drosophila yakuba]